MSKRIPTLVIWSLVLIQLFGLFMLQETRVKETRYAARLESAQKVCKEWQNTYPQALIYDDCVKRNMR